MVINKHRKYTVLKWLAGILTGFCLCAGFMLWYVSIKLRPKMTEQVKSMVLNSTDSLYRIDFKILHANLITGSASLIDVKINPDSNRYKKLVELKRAPNNLYHISLKKLVVQGFHPYQIYKNKKLDINRILFDKPEVSMVNKQLDFNENRPPRPIKSPYDYVAQFLKEIRVEIIDFKNISFKYINKNDVTPEVDSISKLNITLKDMLIDSTSVIDKNRLYLLKDVIINLNDYQFATPDSMYFVNLNQLDFTASTGKLNIKQFGLVPRYDEMKFGKVAGYARDRYSIQMNDINFNHIDLPLYVRKQELKAAEMNIANGYVAVFNNNMLPKHNVDRIGRYPHQLLQKVKAPISIQKINLKNIDVSYAEFDRGSFQRGIVTFKQTGGTITNATNVDKIKAANPFMIANLTTYMMGSGKLEVNFKFNLTANNGAFDFKGSLINMQGRLMNRLTRPLGMVQIKHGDVKKLSFDVKANDNMAKGNLSFAYNNFSIALMKRDMEKGRLVRRGWMSFLANNLIINADNPDENGRFVTAKIDYKRETKSSFFNFLWRSLFQGIKYSVGITPQKEQEIKLQMQKFEQIKADRAKRKAIRFKRIKPYGYIAQ